QPQTESLRSGSRRITRSMRSPKPPPSPRIETNVVIADSREDDYLLEMTGLARESPDRRYPLSELSGRILFCRRFCVFDNQLIAPRSRHFPQAGTASTTLTGEAVGMTRVIRNEAFASSPAYSSAVRSIPPGTTSMRRSSSFPG